MHQDWLDVVFESVAMYSRCAERKSLAYYEAYEFFPEEQTAINLGMKMQLRSPCSFFSKREEKKAITDKSPRTLSLVLVKRAIRVDSKPYNSPECISNAMIQLSR